MTESRARMLYPLELPQCEAGRQTPYASDTDATDKQCKWSGKYLIDGRNFCSKHAGQAALQILLAPTSDKCSTCGGTGKVAERDPATGRVQDWPCKICGPATSVESDT